MKNLLKIAIIGCVLAALLCSCPGDSGGKDPGNNPGNTTDFNMAGTYTFTVNSSECTWVFKADGNYEVTGYNIEGTKTGTWSAKGDDITLSYASSGGGAVSGSEVFTVQKNGNQLTLSLKDNSAQVSLLLVSLGLADKSVVLTTKTGNGNGNGTSSVWTAVTDSTFGDTWIDHITYGNGKFVAVGYMHMAYSSDGINWTAVTDSTFGDTWIDRITWGNGKFVATGGSVAYSSDGIKWTALSDNAFVLYRIAF